MVGQEPDRLPQRGLDEAHLLLDQADVEEEEEDRWRRGGLGGEGVLDGGVLWVELGGDVGFADHGVVLWEVIALEAKGADPDLGGEVDAGVGI